MCYKLQPNCQRPCSMKRWKITSFILWPLLVAAGIVVQAGWIVSYPVRVYYNYKRTRKFYKMMNKMCKRTTA